jgi:hypothetical protein
MTVSIGSSFIIALVIVIALAMFIGIVVLADRRPHFRRPRPPQSPTGVRGGIHQGDPRSVAPRRHEPVEPVEPSRHRR